MLFKTTQGTFLFIGLLLVIIEEGLAIKCYQCNTYLDDGCENPGAGSGYLQECPGSESVVNTGSNSTEYMCRKIEQEINIHGDDTTRIIRQCAIRESAGGDGCLERTGTYRFKSWYCECKTDGCNGASIATLSTAASIVALAIFFRNSVL